MSNTTLGIDVSKLELSVALLEANKPTKAKFSNDIAGFKKLDKWLNKKQIGKIKICMEATGYYSHKVSEFFYTQGYPVYVVNPFCIKSFASGKLARNKTDEADALIIAEYIRVNEARLYKPMPKINSKIRALDKALEALKLYKVQAKNQLSSAEHLPKEAVKIWKNTVDHFDKEIAKLESAIEELILSDKNLKEDYENLQSIPGINSTTATTILSLIPNVSDFKTARQLAAFAGLTPRQKSSGASVRGKTRLSKIGSVRLRKSLFFPAMSAKIHNAIVKEFCDNLLKRSKSKMVVIGAAMRKLMHIIFAVLKNKTVFDAEKHMSKV